MNILELIVRAQNATGQTFKDVKDGMQDLGKGAEESAKDMVSLGLGVSAAAAAIGTLVVEMRDSVVAFAAYETKMTQIQALTDAQPAAVQRWRSELLALSGETAKGPEELAKALYFVSSAGIEGAKALEITRNAALASSIGMGETAKIAQTLTSIMNAYKSQNLDAATAMNVFTATVREGGAEADQLAGSIGRIAGVAANFGVSFQEVGAFIATFTRVIPSAAEAVTSLRQTIMNLENPSKKTENAMRMLGLSAEDVRRSIKEKGLMETLSELIRLSEGNVDVLGDLIPNVRALAGVMATAGSQGKDYKDVLADIKASHGDFAAAVETSSQTLTFQWGQVKASLEAVKTAAGGELAQSLREPLADLAAITKWFSQVASEASKVRGEMDKLSQEGPWKWVSQLTTGLERLLPTATNVWKTLKDIASLGKSTLELAGLKDIGSPKVVTEMFGPQQAPEIAFGVPNAFAILSDGLEKELEDAKKAVAKASKEMAKNFKEAEDAFRKLNEAAAKSELAEMTKRESEFAKALVQDVVDLRAELKMMGDDGNIAMGNLQTATIGVDQGMMDVIARSNQIIREAVWKPFAEGWAGVAGIMGQLGGLFDALGIAADSFVAKTLAGLQGMASAMSAFGQAMASGDPLAQIGAGIGLLGAGVSFIGGLFGGKEEWEKVADELSATFGKEFSEGLAKAIAETEEKENVSRAMAELLNLSEIIDESGQDARDFTTQIASLFSAIADGAVPATEGVAELGQVFDQVRQAAQDAGVVGDRVMVQMIQQARAMGMQVPEITAAVREALDQAIGGVGAMAGGIQILTAEDAAAQAQIFSATFWAKFQEDGAVAAVQAMSASFQAIQDAAAAGGFDVSAIFGPIADLMALATEETAPLLDGIMGLQDALEGLANAGYLTMGSFQGVEQQAASAFNQLIGQGVDSKVALEAIAPLLGQLKDAAANYGLELDSVTQGLLAQADAAGIAFPTDPMQEVVSLLTTIASALTGVSEDALRAGQVMRDGFAAGGREATAAVQQSVVDMTSAMDGFAEGQEELAQYVQQQWTSNIQEIPFWLQNMQPLMEDGFNAFADAADPALRRVRSATGGILADLQDITAGDWTVNIQGPGSGDGGSGGGGGTQAPRPPKQAAFGAFVPARPGGTLFNVGEGGQAEIITPVSEALERIGNAIAARLQGGGGGGVIHNHIHLDGRELLSWMQAQADTRRFTMPRG